MTEINHRARKILHAIVSEYLATGDAVGSRTVTRRYGIELSPATVRNVMADLEELGLVRQLHTSAGRVPTDRGLRFFVDSLLKVRSLSPKEKEDIRLRYELPNLEFEELMKQTSKVLSEMTQHAAVVLAARPEVDRFEHVEFIRLRDGSILVVLVSQGGQVDNKLLGGASAHGGQPASSSATEEALRLTDAELERAQNYLNSLLDGLSLAELRSRVLGELARDKSQLDELASKALELGKLALPERSSELVIIDGQANLIESAAPQNLERMKALFKTLDEKEMIVQLLDRTMAAERIQVYIGAENEAAGLADVSVIAVPYGPEDRPIGTLGVIGPTRMNYSKVIGLVDFTAQIVSDVLGRRS
ncbi:MAG: heat-inducible transcription repressor HrcA [Deltaproteobacteria bacterium]|nr:heat-inducible transcription repressor HrcA [Deltaproteobacteria bacterium]